MARAFPPHIVWFRLWIVCRKLNSNPCQPWRPIRTRDRTTGTSWAGPATSSYDLPTSAGWPAIPADVAWRPCGSGPSHPQTRSASCRNRYRRRRGFDRHDARAPSTRRRLGRTERCRKAPMGCVHSALSPSHHHLRATAYVPSDSPTNRRYHGPSRSRSPRGSPCRAEGHATEVLAASRLRSLRSAQQATLRVFGEQFLLRILEPANGLEPSTC